jgi:hypothetical protein
MCTDDIEECVIKLQDQNPGILLGGEHLTCAQKERKENQPVAS